MRAKRDDAQRLLRVGGPGDQGEQDNQGERGKRTASAHHVVPPGTSRILCREAGVFSNRVTIMKAEGAKAQRQQRDERGTSSMRVARRLFSGVVVAAVLSGALAGQERTRESIADKYKVEPD
jgi:hypothetical protein